VGIVRELGVVCSKLREDAGLHIKFDVGHYARVGERALKNFEAGLPVDRVDQIVKGYALALGKPVSELVRLALARLEADEGGQALIDAVPPPQPKPSGSARKPPPKRRRRADG
jgi:hypothetical protein